jgi:Response regulator of the LytR/AlgR family
MELRIAICDDEQHQAQYIKTFVSKWADKKGIEVIFDMFDSAEKFLSAWIWSDCRMCDMLLLDIQMGGRNGIELAKEIRITDSRLPIIFITGFADYMSEGYDVSALHYLIKPVKEEKLFEVLDKAVTVFEVENEFITLDINRENIIIPLSDIIYIESSLHYILINTVKDQYKTKMTLTEINNKLGSGFFKCTRSFIVGLRYVRRMSNNEVILTNGVSVPLSRGLYKKISKAFIEYF